METERFANPPGSCRGVALWMLNDRLDEARIAEQLDEMADAGWGAVIARTFNGLLTPYLGEQWMDIIARIIERAEQRGMKLWLQAGYMPSALPDLDPSRALRGLAVRPAGEALQPGEVRLAADEQFTYCQHTSDSVIDLLDDEVVRDYLNVAYSDPWYSRFSEHFGRTIEAIWVDEPHFRAPLLPWSRRLPEIFAKQFGYDLTEQIPSLFRPVGEDHQRVRHDYWRCVLGMFLDGYFKPVGRWCDEHGVKFAGHLMGEDTLNNQIGWTAATMPCYQHMQLPGVDHLTGSLSWPTGKPFILTPKQATSVANQLGHARVLAEMYAVSSNGIGFADRKRIADWLMVLGINERCYHGAFYSMRGRRKRVYVPHLSFQQPWWLDNRLIADHFARQSWALRQGRSMAQVLVLHPIESTWCLFDPESMQRPHDRMGEKADVAAMDDRLVKLLGNLLGIQRDFDLGDESLLAEHGSASPQGLRVGQMTYRVVILPELLTIRQTTLALLERFTAAGGLVLAAGPLPERMDGVRSADVARRLAALIHPPAPLPDDSAGLKQALDTAVPALLELQTEEGEAGDVWVQVRQVDSGRLFFITNTNARQSFSGTARLAGCGALEDWDLTSGTTSPATNTPDDDNLNVPLDLPPLGSRLLLMRTNAPAAAVPAANWRTVDRIALDAPGRLTRDNPNSLTLDICQWRRGEEDWQDAMSVLLVQNRLEAENYRGPITLRFAFDSEIPLPGLKVAIEDAADWSITVNDQPVRYTDAPYYIDRSFHPVEIGRNVRPGRNLIELTRDFTPVGKPTIPLGALFEHLEGTELESIYLIGDFAVRGQISSGTPRPGCVRFKPAFTLAAESPPTDADLCEQGYPFYAGRITLHYRAPLRAAAAGERAMLKLPELNAAVVKIRVNGEQAGAIGWPPYELDITSYLREGDNTVEIQLVGSLRNLLGPHHRDSGEPSHTWHVAFTSPPDHNRRQHPEDPEPAWTEDYLVTRFGIGGPVQVCYQQRD